MSTLTLGDAIRSRREQLSVTREQLAVRCGVSVSTVLRLEVHDKHPHLRILTRLCDALGLSLADVLPPYDVDGTETDRVRVRDVEGAQA